MESIAKRKRERVKSRRYRNQPSRIYAEIGREIYSFKQNFRAEQNSLSEVHYLQWFWPTGKYQIQTGSAWQRPVTASFINQYGVLRGREGIVINRYFLFIFVRSDTGVESFVNQNDSNRLQIEIHRIYSKNNVKKCASWTLNTNRFLR